MIRWLCLLLFGSITGCDSIEVAPDSGRQRDASSSPRDAMVPDRPPPTGERPVARGGDYFGFAERFNRYYTDPTWTPSRTVYVSANGTGDGSARERPARASDVVRLVEPGTLVVYLPGTYDNYCVDFEREQSGTYDAPVVLRAERGSAGEYLVHLDCCANERCLNFEGADYIAVDGFEIEGGDYGVRAVGTGFDASEHGVGIAVLNTHAFDQHKDPLFTGHVDWSVWENNVCHGAGSGDGHGIYLSNGSDWNIVRHNELYANASSDFQINADPAFSCVDEGIDVSDPRCDAWAGEGEGGRGASDYMLVENNFFHHGGAQGPNFTSVRRSVVRNNIVGPYARHGVSFWQETDNPRLGSRENLIAHNLFVATNARQMIQFIVDSTDNRVVNNVFVGVTTANGSIAANGDAVAIETDGTVDGNAYAGNVYLSSTFGGDAPRTANDTELVRADFEAAWFRSFPADLAHDPLALSPTASAPFLDFAPRIPEVLRDRDGRERAAITDPGPFEVD